MTIQSLVWLVIGLVFKSTLIYAQTAGPCSRWTPTLNTNYAGGASKGASTLDDCQNSCYSNPSCIAIDWNPTASAGAQCWILTSLSGQKFSGGNSGITHYDLNRACSIGGSTSFSGSTSYTTLCASWTQVANTNYAGGNQTSVNTFLECQSICVATAACIAIDFNQNALVGFRCWLLSNLLGTRFSTTGIIHADLSRSCNNAPSASLGRPALQFDTSSNKVAAQAVDGDPTTSSCTSTNNPQPWWAVQLDTPSFVASVTIYNDLYTGTANRVDNLIVGLSNSAPTVGLPLNSSSYTQCVNASVSIAAGSSSTVTCSSSPRLYKYVIVQSVKTTPDSLCLAEVQVYIKSDAVYKTIFLKTGGVAYVNPTDYRLYFTNDINKAGLFVETQCLAANFSGFNSAQNCVSWYSIDNPDLSARSDFDGRVIFKPADNQPSPERYVEDSSFFAVAYQVATGYSTIQPVIFPGINYYYTAGLNSVLTATVASAGDDSALYYFNQISLPSAAVTDSCPNIWTSIKGAAYVTNLNPVSLGLNVIDCRARCLVYPNCTGVVYQTSYSCTILTTSTSTGSLTVAPKSSTYYELHRSLPRRCTKGCTYIWKTETQNLNQNYFTQYSISDARTCRANCVSNIACLGVIWSTDSNCTAIWSYVYGSYQIGNITFMALYRGYSNCGPCSLQADILLSTTDNNAVIQTGVSGEADCLTACVNNRLCRGFDLRAADQCYLSLTSYPSLSTSTSYNHYEITRSPCGNNCRNKWQFLYNTAMQGGTLQTAYKTERECRMACYIDPNCYQADWNYMNNTCSFGDGTLPVNIEGTSPGWNHFEYVTFRYCDDDNN